MGTPQPRRTTAVLDRVSERALSAGIPHGVVDRACVVTARKFGPGCRSGARSRVEAYFWGVVRRSALRGEAPAAHARLLVTSLASELRAAGHGAAEVYCELQRVYGTAVDTTLIEAYRPVPERAA